MRRAAWRSLPNWSSAQPSGNSHEVGAPWFKSQSHENRCLNVGPLGLQLQPCGGDSSLRCLDMVPSLLLPRSVPLVQANGVDRDIERDKVS